MVKTVEIAGFGDNGVENNLMFEARSMLGSIVSALSSFAYYIYTWGMSLIKQVIYWASKNPFAFTMFIANSLIMLT